MTRSEIAFHNRLLRRTYSKRASRFSTLPENGIWCRTPVLHGVLQQTVHGEEPGGDIFQIDLGCLGQVISSKRNELDPRQGNHEVTSPERVDGEIVPLDG